MQQFRIWVENLHDYQDLIVYLHILNAVIRRYWNVEGMYERHSYDRNTGTYNVYVDIPYNEAGFMPLPERMLMYADKHTTFAPDVYWTRV